MDNHENHNTRTLSTIFTSTPMHYQKRCTPCVRNVNIFVPTQYSEVYQQLVNPTMLQMSNNPGITRVEARMSLCSTSLGAAAAHHRGSLRPYRGNANICSPVSNNIPHFARALAICCDTQGM